VKVKFQLAELLVLCATLLFCQGLSTLGWVFFGCGLFLAFARYSLEYQQRAKLEEDIEQSFSAIKEAFPGFVQGLAKYFNNSNNMH